MNKKRTGPEFGSPVRSFEAVHIRETWASNQRITVNLEKGYVRYQNQQKFRRLETNDD